ncbi:MAG: ATPase [Eggerthellaceae bacterium]|jgi:cell division septum initiation protein DivIVA|nr:ATPase [Eggerthellaceae bacterium]
MDETGVLGLIEELSILLEDSKPAFGRNSNIRQVDVAAAFEIIDDIRDAFPSEFAQSRQIVRERQSLLDDAEAEADRMIEDARNQALTIASEQEIVRISQQQADQIMADARELERETRAGAEDYADEVFGHVEQSLDSLLANVRRCRDRLNSSASNAGGPANR